MLNNISNNMKPSGSLVFRFIKRLFDVIVSAILMIPVGIVIIISGILMKKIMILGAGILQLPAIERGHRNGTGSYCC